MPAPLLAYGAMMLAPMAISWVGNKFAERKRTKQAKAQAEPAYAAAMARFQQFQLQNSGVINSMMPFMMATGALNQGQGQQNFGMVQQGQLPQQFMRA